MVGGLQEPSKRHVCSIDIKQVEFMRILHDGHGHWLMVSTVGAKNGQVHVYNSMYPSVGTYSKNRLLQFCAPNQSKIECISWMCKCRSVAVTAGSL